MSEQTPTNKLSVYLIKDRFSNHEDILKNIESLESREIEGVGQFYFGESHTFEPDWIRKFFGSTLSGESSLYNASSKGVLLVKIEIGDNIERIFAIPFGYGWNYLIPGVWEERFGLMIALNAVDENNLKRIDKKNMSSVPKDTNEQLSKSGMAADFGIDIEQDLIQSITGKSKDKNIFGQSITGKDSLSVSVKVDLENLKDFLKQCYEAYKSDEYKNNFGWIDQVAEIKDLTVIDSLNCKLIEKIKEENFEKIWMAVPEIVDWYDVAGFSYKNKKEDLKDDICLRDFMDSLSEDEKDDLKLELFEKKIVNCFSASSNESKHHWRVYNCLYCEIQDDENERTYLLSNGKWYEIEKDFASQVNTDYQQFRDQDYGYSLPNYNHENEADYNEKIAEDSSDTLYCLDRKIISHGGGYSKIEFCDLISNDNKIIHVKHYGGSSVLSHLFSQGVVSGELFLADKEFRDKVNVLLPTANKLTNTTSRPNPRDYEIVFAIISSKDGVLEIPFFSKVSLRNTRRRLETYGYKVYFKKIEMD